MNNKLVIKVIGSEANYRYHKCIGKKFIVKKVDKNGYHIRNYDKGVPQNFVIDYNDARVIEYKKDAIKKFDKILYGFFIFIAGLSVGYGWAFYCYFLQTRG